MDFERKKNEREKGERERERVRERRQPITEVLIQMGKKSTCVTR